MAKNTISKITASKAKALKRNKVAKAEIASVADKPKFVRKDRAVSFTVVTVKNRRTFTPVNKRAKAVAELAGSDTLTVKQLKALKSLKAFRIVEGGTLTPISL